MIAPAPRSTHSFPPPIDPDGDSLFLDVDGTLAEITETPHAAALSPAMLRAIAAAQARLGGRMALVSGRSVATLQRLVPLPGLALAGLHGLERLLPGRTVERPAPPPGLEQARRQIAALAALEHGYLVEDKGLSIGLHYRADPSLGPEALARLSALADQLGLVVQQGKMVVELRPAGADKGDALLDLLATPAFRGSRPVFAGDDLTDESAFAAAAARGGHGVFVGPPPPDTAARFALPGVAAVEAWLGALA